MEKITLENLLLWSDEDRWVAVKKLCGVFEECFAFDARAVLGHSTWGLPWDRLDELQWALWETSCELRRQFIKAFTDRRGLDPDDCESLAPWLHPREWDGNLEGETVKEMAENYAVKNWHEFSWLLKEEEEDV